MKNRFLVSLVLLTSLFVLIGCGSSLPRPKTAQGAIKSYFKGYGREYKTTDFHKYKIDEVEVGDIEGLQKDLAQARAYVSLEGGKVVYKVSATLAKKTLRWKVVSWENLGKAE